MNTVGTVERAWSSLEAAYLPGSEMRVLEAEEPELQAGRPLFALDSQGQRHLLIPVLVSTQIVEDRNSSGVQIYTRQMFDSGILQSYVDVICLKPHLHEVFSIVVSEMLDLLKNNTAQPDHICKEVLNRWRELLARDVTQRPSMTMITGLFGELWQLRELTRRDPIALRSWVGPTKARYDFFQGNVALEVKSTVVRHGRFFEIHGHQQLEAPHGGQLYLATLKLEQLPGTGDSLRDLVEQIVTLVGDRSTLMKLLMHAGITSADLNGIENIRFQVLEHRMYQIDSNFPRITSDSFKNGAVPNGVLRIMYQIDLTNEPPHPLDATRLEIIYRELISGGHFASSP